MRHDIGKRNMTIDNKEQVTDEEVADEEEDQQYEKRDIEIQSIGDVEDEENHGKCNPREWKTQENSINMK